MKVEAFDPSRLSVSDRAVKHISQQLKKEKKQFLQLGLTESGCNGFAFELDFVRQRPADCIEFEFGEDVCICVSESHWQHLRGTRIDYVTEGLNSMLKFDNPNADAVCGCGESFSLSGT